MAPTHWIVFFVCVVGATSAGSIANTALGRPLLRGNSHSEPATKMAITPRGPRNQGFVPLPRQKIVGHQDSIPSGNRNVARQSNLVGTLAAAGAAIGQTATTISQAGGLFEAVSLIFLSELGDKTFFVTAIYASKFPKWLTFTAAVGALALMTVLSVMAGQVFKAVPDSLGATTIGPIPLFDAITAAAFFYFGIKNLLDAWGTEEGKMNEELEDAEKAVDAAGAKDEQKTSLVSAAWQVFSLVFVAEIGDRSMFSTIALSIAENPVNVIIGAIAGHTGAVILAILGGTLVSKSLSEKAIGIISGTLFLIFGFTTLLGVF